jgi:hypothetical protein
MIPVKGVSEKKSSVRRRQPVKSFGIVPIGHGEKPEEQISQACGSIPTLA